MKNFLKSTALFACIALLFTACSEDGTEDVSGSVVAIPSITEATPGDGKIYLEWEVPTICDADESVITWLDESNALVGSYTEAVVAGGEYTYTIGESEPLAAGSYTVTIANRVSTTGDESNAATQVVVVYSASSYEAMLPVPADYYYEVISSTTGTVHITWGAFHADCKSVTVYYGTDFGTPKSVANLAEGEETLLQGVAPGGAQFKYVATFCPTADGDEVSVWSDVLDLGITASAPANVAAKSGLNRFELSWDLLEDEFEYITSVEISYSGGDDISLAKDDLVVGTNTISLSATAGDYYSASLYTLTSGGFISETATLESDVWVYDVDSFTLPIVTEVVNDKGTVTVYWATAEHITGWNAYVKNSDESVSDAVAMTYEDETDDEGAITRIYTTVFDSPELGAAIYISDATYLPEGAIEDDVVTLDAEDTGYTVPANPQYTPVITSVSTTNEAKITLTWDIEAPYDLASSVINLYADGSDTPVAVTSTSVAESDNTATITTEDGIEAGTTYSIKVQTTSSLGDLSAESDAFEGVLAYNSETFTASNYPTPTATFTDGQVTVAWESIGYAQSLTLVYGTEEYTYALNETKDDLVLTGDATSFAYQEGNTTFTIKDVVFLPTYAVDGSSVTATATSDAFTIAAPVPTTPTLTSVTTGYETVAGDTPSYTSYMVVDWTIDAADAVADDDAKTTIYYKASADADADYTPIVVTTVAGQTAYTSDKIAVTKGETYSVYVVTTSQYAVASESSEIKSITAYDATSYDTAPTISQVSLVANTDTTYDAVVTWDSFSGADLQSVIFSYGDSQTASATFTEGALDATATLSTVTLGAAYSYTATFCPEGGIEGVDVVVSDLTFPSVAIPAFVSAVPGYDEDNKTSKITATWTLSATSGVETIRVYYFESDVTFDSASSSYITATTDATTATITGLEAKKTYLIYVASVNASDSVFEDAVNYGTVTTYGELTYADAEVTPTINTESDVVTVSPWVTSNDILSTDDYYVEYTCGTVTGTITDFASATTFAYLYGSTTSFTYDLYIKPSADYVGYVKVAQDAVAVPEQAPDAPTALAATYGIDADGKSYINLTWAAGGVDDVAKYVLYYTIGEGTETTMELTDSATTLESYKFEDIQSDNFGTYAITLTTQTTAGTESAKTAQTTAIAYGDATYASATLPTLSASVADDVVTMVWGTEDVSDLYSVTYTYGETTATILAADLAETTVAYVYGTETISYTVAFQPEGGSGTVTRTATDVTFAEQAPSAPTDVAVSAYGYNETDGAYATITWVEPTSTATIANAVVYAADADGAKTDAVELAAGTLTNTFKGLTAGKTYTFYVATKTANGTASADVASTTTVTAYDASSYSADNLPTAEAVCDLETFVVTVTFSDLNADLQKLTLTYGDTTSEVDITASPVTATFTYAEATGNTYSYAAEFAPEGAVGNVAIDGGSGVFVTELIYDIVLNNGVYEIYTGTGLAVFADLVNGTYNNTTATVDGFEFTAASDAQSTISGKVMDDIDLSKVCSADKGNWVPIGTPSAASAAGTAVAFIGTFDGGSTSGYTISNLYYNGSTSYIGLFGGLGATGVIQNVTLVDPSIYNTQNIVGGVVGLAWGTDSNNTCSITNCEVKTSSTRPTISTASTPTYSAANFQIGGTSGTVGGVAGRVVHTVVTNCTNDVNVWGAASGDSSGGVVGIASNATKQSATLTGCVNKGTIYSSRAALAGIAGYGSYNVVITNCHNEGLIYSSYGTTNANAGGIIGRAFGNANGGVTLSECTNKEAGTVYSSSSSSTALGGVVGYAEITATGSVTFASCHNYGTVESKGNAAGGVVGHYSAGGTTSTFTVEGNSNTGSVTGVNYIGGVIGYQSVTSSSAVTVKGTSNSANITGTGYVGGIIGAQYTTGSATAPITVTGNTNSGTITASTDTAGQIIGGVVDAGDDDTSANNVTSTNTESGSLVTPSSVAAADAVTVSSAALNAAKDAITVTWSYTNGYANTSKLVVYYKVSAVDTYTAIEITDFATTTASFDAVVGNTYEIYVVTENSLGGETAATSGGTATSPLEVDNPIDVSTTDIYLNESGVYEIRTVAGLVAFQELVNGTAATTTPDVVSNVASWTKDVSADAVLINDLDLSEVCSADSATNWTPIGALGSVYTGTFDGGEKTISNLYINDSATTYRALFSYISGATIKNLTLDKPIVSGAGNTSAMISNAVGTAIIDNCHLTGAGTITGAGTNSGGIVGYASPALIQNCTTAAEMTLSGTGSNASSAGIAGITGHIAGTMINCHNAASVSGSRNVGGITGYTGAVTFIGCSNSGYVYSGKSAGGIVGKSNGQLYVIGCYNTGKISTTSTTGTEIAGIVGCSNSNVTLYGCYNTGIANNGLTGYYATETNDSVTTVKYTYAYVGCYYVSSLVTASSGAGMNSQADSLFEGGMAGVTSTSVLDYISTSCTTSYEVDDETVEYTTVSMNDAIETALVDNTYVSSCVINADGTATVTYVTE